MPRKNLNKYTQVQIEKAVLKELKKRKIHPNQSYSEIIKQILEEKHESN